MQKYFLRFHFVLLCFYLHLVNLQHLYNEMELYIFHYRIVFFSFGKAKKYGLYYKILEEAQKEYPTANDVVNVTVDFEGTSFLIFQKGTYTTTALAVRYK